MRSVAERYESFIVRGRTPAQIRAVAVARGDAELREMAEKEGQAEAAVASAEVFA